MKKAVDGDVKTEEKIDEKEQIKAEEGEPGGLAHQEDVFFEVNDRRAWVDEDDFAIELIQKNAQLEFFSKEFKKKAEESEKKLFEYIGAYKKNLEENEAFKKRLEFNSQKQVEQAKGDILMSLLPVKDNLDRAVSSVNGSDKTSALLDGINMVRKLFLEQMKQNGLTLVEAVGKPFDPEKAEAVAVEKVTKKKSDNIVMEEFEPGYELGGRLLRPARVKVGKYEGE
ncbi:MAG: nucleotide exchange factor GrpE [Nitrospinota bacterium]